MRSEDTILRAVDHPYLAKLYATIQTGEASADRSVGGPVWVDGAGRWTTRTLPSPAPPSMTQQQTLPLLQHHAVPQRPTSTSCWSTAPPACCTMSWSGEHMPRRPPAPGRPPPPSARPAPALRPPAAACRLPAAGPWRDAPTCTPPPQRPGPPPARGARALAARCPGTHPRLAPPSPRGSAPDHCLPEEEVRKYAAEVLLALQYLHLQGFIYR